MVLINNAYFLLDSITFNEPLYLVHCLFSGAYAGFLKGGGPTLKFLGFWIYMPRSGMSRAAKLRAFARGVWGHAPPRNFFKMVQFRAFCGLFSTTFMVKNSLKKI